MNIGITFLKKIITKYNYEDNLKHYRNTYKEGGQRLIDILNKKGELTENENILKCEYINAKKILRELIEKERSKYFSDLDNVVEVFGPVSIADLFLKLNGDDQDKTINNPDTYDPNYIYYNNKLYCYKNGIWIQSNDELRENVKNIFFSF